MEDGDLAGMRPGNRLEPLNAFELALERLIVLERLPTNDFHGALSSQQAAHEPHVAVAAAADLPQHFIIGNSGAGVSRVDIVQRL